VGLAQRASELVEGGLLVVNQLLGNETAALNPDTGADPSASAAADQTVTVIDVDEHPVDPQYKPDHGLIPKLIHDFAKVLFGDDKKTAFASVANQTPRKKPKGWDFIDVLWQVSLELLAKGELTPYDVHSLTFPCYFRTKREFVDPARFKEHGLEVVTERVWVMPNTIVGRFRDKLRAAAGDAKAVDDANTWFAQQYTNFKKGFCEFHIHAGLQSQPAKTKLIFDRFQEYVKNNAVRVADYSAKYAQLFLVLRKIRKVA